MSARLIMDMEAEAAKLEREGAGYRLAGERPLSFSAHTAAVAIRNAVHWLTLHHEGVADAQTERDTH